MQAQLEFIERDLAGAEDAAAQLEQQLGVLSGTSGDAAGSTDILTGSTTEAAKAAQELTREIDAQASAAQGLVDSLYPVIAQQEKYAREKAQLIAYMLQENKSNEWLEESLARHEQSYRNSGDAASAYGLEVESVAGQADPFASAWEEAAKRIDETFADAFAGAFDSFEDFGDQLLDGFKRLLAELAYQATLKPIVVSLTGDVQGLMGGGGGGSGNLLSTGKSAYDAVTGGFGNIAWTGASNTAYAGSGFANSATSGIGQSGFLGGSPANFSGATGIASAGAGYAGGYVGTEAGGLFTDKEANSSLGATAGGAIGTFFGGPAGGFIGGFLGGIADTLFGSEPPDPSAHYVQQESGSNWGYYDSELSSTGGFGFNIDELGGEEARDGLTELGLAISAFDNVLASTRTGEQLDSIRADMDEFNANLGDILDGTDDPDMDLQDGVAGRFQLRLARILEAGEFEFSKFAIETASSLGELSKYATGIVNLSESIKGMGGAVSDDIAAELEKYSDTESFGGAIAAMQRAAATMGLLEGGVDRLGLQFDAAAEGAIHAANSLQAMVGGVGNLANIQSSYYQAVFSDTEKLSHRQEDLSSALSGVTDASITTTADLRALVEAQDLNTAAGRELAIQLMQLAPALAQTSQAVERAITEQYEDILNRAPDAAGLAYWMDEVSSGAVTLEQALALIADSAKTGGAAIADMSAAIKARTALEKQLLQAQGNTDALREIELAKLRALEGADKQGLEALQERIWAVKDAAEADKDAARAAQAAARAAQSAAQAAQSAAQAAAQATDQVLSEIRKITDSEIAAIQAQRKELEASLASSNSSTDQTFDRLQELVGAEKRAAQERLNSVT